MMENKTADYKNFTEISKRLAKSGYKKFVVHNRMIMGFYDLTQDSDVGMHYIMHVPDEYEDLYDGHFIFDNDKFTKQLAEIRNKAKEERTKLGLPPRVVDGCIKYRPKDELEENAFIIEVSLQIHELVDPPAGSKRKSKVLGDVIQDIGFMLPCPDVTTDEWEKLSDNMMTSLSSLTNRVGTQVVLIDAIENGLVEPVVNYPRVFYCDVKVEGESVQVPLMKSFFRGINKFDQLILTVQKTKIKGVFVYCITLSAKGLTDQYISYIQNFK